MLIFLLKASHNPAEVVSVNSVIMVKIISDVLIAHILDVW